MFPDVLGLPRAGGGRGKGELSEVLILAEEPNSDLNSVSLFKAQPVQQNHLPPGSPVSLSQETRNLEFLCTLLPRGAVGFLTLPTFREGKGPLSEEAVSPPESISHG